jgi:hypothetical protein
MKPKHRWAPEAPAVKRRFRLKLKERAERTERRDQRTELQDRERDDVRE